MIDLNNIVEILYSELSPEDIEVLKDCEKFAGKYGIEFHMTAGMDIRNRFKLWEDSACGNAHQDDVSAEILHRLICKVKQEDPMNNYWTWEKAAKICQEKYGVFVSFDEGDEWFECPECGEPILKEDWEGENLIHCPVCEYNFDTEEYDDEC